MKHELVFLCNLSGFSIDIDEAVTFKYLSKVKIFFRCDEELIAKYALPIDRGRS